MLSGLVRPGKSISLSRCVSSPGSLLTNQHRLELKMPDADPFAVLDAKAWVSAGLAPSGGSQRGPFLPLPAAGGSRRPSAGDTPLPPLPPFTWLFLHTSVCLLLCLSSSPVTLPTAGPPLQHDLVSSILHALHVQRPLFQTRLPRRPQAMRRISSQGSRQPRRGSLGEGMGPEGPKSSLPAPPPPASRLQGDSTNRAEPWAGCSAGGGGVRLGGGGLAQPQRPPMPPVNRPAARFPQLPPGRELPVPRSLGRQAILGLPSVAPGLQGCGQADPHFRRRTGSVLGIL